MSVFNVNLGEDQKINLILGQQGENAVTSVVFDFSAWSTAFGSGTLSLSVQRPGDALPYAVVMTVSGTDATWEITDLDTAYKGTGEIQLKYTVGTKVKKSVVHKFTVYRSLGENGEYPSPGQTWQEEIEADIADVKSDLNELKYITTDVFFEKGALGSSDGTTSSSTTRLRSGFLPNGVISVEPNSGYKFMLFAYNSDGTYIGVWNGTAFAKSGSWKTVKVSIPTKEYLYRIVFSNTSDSSIAVSDATNVTFISTTDSLFEKQGVSADAKSVGNFLSLFVKHGVVDVFRPINKYNPATYKASGVNFISHNDGSWTVTGTATSSSYSDICKRQPLSAGIYKVCFNGGTIPLRIFVEYGDGTSDTIINLSSDAYIDIPSNAVSITARFLTTSGTVYNSVVHYNMYRIADSELYQKGVLTPTGDTTDRTADIEFYLNTLGFCHLQQGEYYTTGITMPDKSSIKGEGWGTILALLGDNQSSAISMGSGCNVSDIQIRGSDTSISPPPPASDGNRNGILFDGSSYAGTLMKGTIHNCYIHDFSGGGIRLQYTGIASMGGLSISDCDIEKNYCGMKGE